MLRVENLYKSYGTVEALRGVSLRIQPGEIVALLGHNGAGKTTLVSIVAGLRRPDSGRVFVGEVDVVRRPYDARLSIGLAPQETGIYPVVSVRENLLLFGRLAGLGGRALDHRIDEIAESLRMTPLLGRIASTLSGGEKRRVHTAAALLHRPPLLLLDEPTTGADVGTRAAILEMIRGLAAEGTAVCYSTHYLPEVEAIGAGVAILEEGRMVARDTVSNLIAAHGTSMVELTFEGPAPQVRIESAAVSDSTIRIRSDNPAVSAAGALTALGADAHRLRSIEIVHPSLETVYLGLTGRRFEQEEEQKKETAEVPA